MQTASHIGRETTFDALGQKWTAQRFERGACHEKFIAWAKTILPDQRKVCRREIEELALAALEISKRDDLDPEQKHALLAANRQQQHHAAEYSIDMQSEALTIDSKPVAALMATDEGGRKVVEIMLAKHHPSITSEQIADIVDELGEAGMKKVFDQVNGVIPPNGQGPASA